MEFRPFAFKVEKYLIQIINIGIKSNLDLMGAGIGYMSSFIGEYNKKQTSFIQIVELNYLYQIAIYQFNQNPILILGTSLNNVWEKTGLFKKFCGTQHFGLKNSLIQKKIATQKISKCTPVSWNNEAITNNIFDYHLKKQTIANINWQQLFQNWLNQPSTIIELRGMLQQLYPYNYTFNERELRAWHALLKAMRCVEITPYSKDQSDVNIYFSISSLCSILLK